MITNVSLTGLRNTREVREHIVGEQACEEVSRAVFCDYEGQGGRPEPQFGKTHPSYGPRAYKIIYTVIYGSMVGSSLSASCG